MNDARFALAISLVLLLGSALGWAGQCDQCTEQDRAELGQALKDATVSLEQGLVASVPKGKPISGKFELEDGTLHLSVYTAKGDRFSEVLVDPKTGLVTKVDAIDGGEDLTAARAQADAMAKATTGLRAALDVAAKKHPGFRPIGVIPALKNGHSVAEVTLMKGHDLETVSEALE